MNKILRTILIISGSLFVAYVIFGQTDFLKIYSIPTRANEPNIKLNAKIVVSNLTDFKNGDFVCYQYENEMSGKHVRVHRLVGGAGDVVEIRDGILFVNGKNVDQDINLKHLYIIEFAMFNNLLASKKIAKDDASYKVGNTMILFLSDYLAKEIGVSDKIKIEPKGSVDKFVQQVYKADWNMDNLGPLRIPEGRCFVIGDNRHNSADSRYIGLINESDIIGTVIMK